MPDEENKFLKPLIIDIGSDKFRIGWGGNDFPELIAPSVYVDMTDFLFESDIIEGLEEIFIEDEEKHYYGHQAIKYQNILKTHEFKKEKNYVIFSKYFQYYYEQLEIPEEFRHMQPIIILSSFMMSDLEKAKLQQIFLEELEFPYLLFLDEAKAILSTLGKTSGVIVNIGESNTYISTIFHGFTNIMARDIFPVSGKELTLYFHNLILTGKASQKNFYLDKWLTKEIKEKTSLCLLNPKSEKKRVKEGFTKYNRVINLPDNSNLLINYERFMISEPLFDPKIIHIDYESLPESVSKTIKFWDRQNWEELLPNIILAGGSSKISGLKERLESELKKYFSEKLKPKIKVIAPGGREHIGWIGASILFIQDQLDEGWIKNPKLNSLIENIEEQGGSK
ncbi:MAG: hypothetical protein EU548_04550 [Promethearchaeota archaeon]|nr:MAG: hypothetical protein EU548_04550 [Candidatus Lokiarchaeota archaeon]